MMGEDRAKRFCRRVSMPGSLGMRDGIARACRVFTPWFNRVNAGLVRASVRMDQDAN